MKRALAKRTSVIGQWLYQNSDFAIWVHKYDDFSYGLTIKVEPQNISRKLYKAIKRIKKEIENGKYDY